LARYSKAEQSQSLFTLVTLHSETEGLSCICKMFLVQKRKVDVDMEMGMDMDMDKYGR
jgi:hypothetical protein